MRTVLVVVADELGQHRRRWCAWLCRNVRQVWLDGRPGPRQRERRMERLLATIPSLSSSPLMRSVPQSGFSRGMVVISSRISGLRWGRPPRDPDFPAPEQAPALPMPADHCVRCDQPQMLTPAGADSASQDPEQLVPGAQPSTWSGASRAGEDGELVPQEQVLEHKVLARPQPGPGGRKEQPEQFEHAVSIADLRPPEVLPSHSGSSGCRS